jgi:hypothetical protein
MSKIILNVSEVNLWLRLVVCPLSDCSTLPVLSFVPSGFRRFFFFPSVFEPASTFDKTKTHTQKSRVGVGGKFENHCSSSLWLFFFGEFEFWFKFTLKTNLNKALMCLTPVP